MEEKIKKLEPSDNDILVIRVPEDASDVELEEVIYELTDVLRSIDPSPGFIVIPESMDIDNIPERKMNEIGWFRRVDVK